jgi:hypothetical protein
MENKPKTRLVKGSEQAKQYMSELRSKRGANKQTPVETPTPTPPTTPTQPIEIPPPTKSRSKKINVDFT